MLLSLGKILNQGLSIRGGWIQVYLGLDSRSKSREVKVRELPGAELAVEDSKIDENGQEVELGMEEVTMDTSHLSEFECTAVKKKGKRSKNNKAQGMQKDLEEVEFLVSIELMHHLFLKVGEEEDGEAVVLTELLTAVMSGNTKALGSLVDRVREGEVGRSPQICTVDHVRTSEVGLFLGFNCIKL